MKKLLFLIFSCALVVSHVHAAPGVLPPLRAQGFSVQPKNGGGFIIENGGKTYAIESKFSYPMMQGEKWNALVATNEKVKGGEWKWSAKSKPNGFVIEGAGKFYRLQRNVSLKDDHIVIADTFSNISNQDIGIAFDNKVSSLSTPRAVNVAGVYKKILFPV